MSDEHAPDNRPDDDPARRLLERARAAAGPRAAGSGAGSRRGTGRTGPTRSGGRSQREGWSGAGPDQRDPGLVGDALRDLVGDRDWGDTLAAAGIIGRWDQIVGADLAAHCRPARLEGAELTLVAESTAWATQIRLLSRHIVARISAEVRPGLVRTVRVHGPTAPDWQHGPRRVAGGRGPRDTYG